MDEQTTELDRLQRRLDDMDCKQFHVTLNEEGPRPTAEQVAAECNRALDALERGDYEDVTDEDD